MKAHRREYPLSSGQRWLLHLLEQAPDMARPVQRLYRLGSAFDAPVFVQALERTVAAHPALRLQLVPGSKGWQQRFSHKKAALAADEIVGRTPAQRSAYATLLLAREAQTTLNLQKEAPVKVRIVRVDDEHFLSICIDHLAADEAAFDLFEHELLETYRQLQQGPVFIPVQADALPAYLEREEALQPTEEAHLSYWQEQLKEAPGRTAAAEEPLWVPGSVWHHQLKGPLLQALQDFCRTHRCSLFHVLLAVQLLLLSEAGAGTRIVLNLPVSNRVRATDRSIIANLSMLLHICFTLQAGETAAALVLRVRDQVLAGMAHRQYDYSALAEWIDREADSQSMDRAWLLGANFIVDVTPMAFPNTLFEERLDNLPGRRYDVPRHSFTMATRQKEGSLELTIDWDAAAWPIAEADMETRFLQVVQKFTGEPK